jgi:transposase InsO family protein
VHTFRRDYVNVHELHDAASVLAQLAAWIDGYNRLAPHSALGMRSLADYRAVRSASRETHAPVCVGLQGAIIGG